MISTTMIVHRYVEDDVRSMMYCMYEHINFHIECGKEYLVHILCIKFCVQEPFLAEVNLSLKNQLLQSI